MNIEWQEFDGDALPFDGKKILMRFSDKESVFADPADVVDTPTHWREPACGCGKLATCWGSYEDSNHEFACDECCGHWSEDGHCEQLDECDPQIVRLQCEVDELRQKLAGNKA